MEANVNIDKVETYLRGKMNASEKLEFESELAKNPALTKEVAFQRSLKNGIVSARKLALKARLDGLSVSLGTSSGASGSFAPFKAAAIILASTGMGLAGYLYFNNEPSAPSTVIATEQTSSSVSEDQVVLKDEKELVYTSSDVAKSAPESSEVKEVAPKAEVETKAKLPRTVVAPKSTKKVPNMDSFVDDSQSAVSSHTETPAAVTSNEERLTKMDVDIKNIQDGKHKFHYKLESNVLYLYGNFDDARYEILEFNKKDNQIVYLFYKDSYFGMENNSATITKLKPLTDAKLIENLEKLRVR